MSTRGRPKSDQKRQQILDAAVDLFTGSGYERTTLEQVALAAGVSKQTIYNNFPNKDALLSTCIERRCEQGQITAEGLDYSLPPGEFLRLFAQRFVSTLTADKPLALYRLILTESDRHPEVGKSFFESGPRPIMTAFAQYLRVATERGELQVDEPDLASSQFLFMIKGFAVDRSLLGLPENIMSHTGEEYVEHCCAAFLRAFSPGHRNG